MKVAVLGAAGLIGAGIVRDLVSDQAIVPIESVRVADASRPGIGRLLSEIQDQRLEPVNFDASHPLRLAAAVSDVDIVINALPTLLGMQMAIFEACLEAQIPYTDLGGLASVTLRQKEMHERFRAAGVYAVVGAGADPGMTNMMCRAAADQLDAVDAIDLYAATEIVGPENPVLVPPYTLATILAEYRSPSAQFIDGRQKECPPMSGEETLDLPEPWGRCAFVYSPRSQPLTLPATQGIREKGVRRVTARLHRPRREHEAWLGLVKAGFWDFDEPVEIGNVSVRPIDVLSAVIYRNIERRRGEIPHQQRHDIRFANASGTRHGKPAAARAEVVTAPDPRFASYVDAATSMSASLTAQLLLAKPPGAGVWAPEEVFAPEAYFAELDRRGFRTSLTVA